MKKKILSLLAAFFMLFGTSAMAQVDSTLEGDVNGDGVVDIADITAVIAIIKQNAEANPTYYWYVGQTNPASMTSITPVVTENGVTGWRKTGSTLTATYEYNSTDYPISSDPSQNSMWYYALPENTGLGAFDAQNENYAVNPISSVTINGVKYNIYEGGASRKFNALTIKNK